MAESLRFEHRMSASDALMWSIEKDPMLRSTITAVALLDRAPDRARLMDKLDRATRLVPRMRQRVVHAPLSVAPPRWAVDRHFNLSYHVRWMRAPGAGTLRDLLDVAEPVAMQGFDRARPLWEFVIVEGLEGGRAAVIQKIHHAITDGVGGMKLAMAMVDLEREPADGADGEMPVAPAPDDWSFPRRMVDATQHEVGRQLDRLRRAAGTVPAAAADPIGAARSAREVLASLTRLMAPVSEPLSPIMRGRSLSVRFDTISVPLAELKASGKAAGGKLNDAFVAAVAAGFRRYHEHHDAPVAALRMNMPISVRDESTAELAGNQFVPARFPVPIDITDPLEHMQAIRSLVIQSRDEPALKLTDTISDLLNRLPTSVVTELFGGMLKAMDFTTSNVPGIPIPVYIGGGKLDALIPFGPLAGVATNITLVSFLDDVHIGVNMDPAAIPDGDVFMACLRDGFGEVLKAG